MTTTPPKREARLLASLIMCWMFVFGMIGTGLVGPNRLAIETEFGLSHSQFGAGYAIIQIVCALLVLLVVTGMSRFGSIAAFILSLVVQAAGFGIVFGSNSAGGLVLGWSAVVLGTVLGSVSNNVSARLWLDNPRRGVTLLHGFNGIGKVAGPLVAVAFLALGWRTSFLVVGLITLALLVPFWRYRARFVAFEPPQRSLETTQRGVLTQPLYWLCVLPFGLIAGGDVAFAAIVPLFYESTYGVSAQTGALLLTIHFVGLAVGRFVCVYLSDRIGNNAVIAGCLASGIAVVPAVLSPNLLVQALALFVVGWMFSSTWPSYYAQVARFFPSSAQHLLDYGSTLGNALGIALCVSVSSAIAERSLAAAVVFGPVVLWVFGLIYFGSRLARQGPQTLVVPPSA